MVLLHPVNLNCLNCLQVDDYLKEYNKDEVVTLSGELEIEANDVENNNSMSKDLRHKPRKTRRKHREERADGNTNGRDVSPKVFKSGSKNKLAGKAGMLKRRFISIKKKITITMDVCLEAGFQIVLERWQKSRGR